MCTAFKLHKLLSIRFLHSFPVFFALALVVSCSKTLPSAPEENTLLDGPTEGLNFAEQAHFL